mmetsp:Transcript_6953/g.16018  ORF Transcript_6953/g.16018 Transcript_6953/m.16018 type:complete len:254 (+) Transcript_6953:1079-1840(+)
MRSWCCSSPDSSSPAAWGAQSSIARNGRNTKLTSRASTLPSSSPIATTAECGQAAPNSTCASMATQACFDTRPLSASAPLKTSPSAPAPSASSSPNAGAFCAKLGGVRFRSMAAHKAVPSSSAPPPPSPPSAAATSAPEMCSMSCEEAPAATTSPRSTSSTVGNWGSLAGATLSCPCPAPHRAAKYCARGGTSGRSTAGCTLSSSTSSPTSSSTGCRHAGVCSNTAAPHSASATGAALWASEYTSKEGRFNSA